MAIIFNCKCGKVFRAKETQAGKTFPCPDCGRAVHVPGSLPVQPAEDPYFAQSTPAEKVSTSGGPKGTTPVNPAVPITTHVVVQQTHPNSNGLGIAGFVLSLVGFLSCGLLSPLGLIFSVIGLRKSPRGLAIAGSVLGLLGSWWLFLFGFAFLGMLGLGGLFALSDASKPAEQPPGPPKLARREPSPEPAVLRRPAPAPRAEQAPAGREIIPVPRPRNQPALASFTETFVNVPEGGLPAGWDAAHGSVGVLGRGDLRRLQASALGTHRVTTPVLEFPDDFELELRAEGDFTVTLQGVDGEPDLPLSVQRRFGARIKLDNQPARLDLKDRIRRTRIRLVRDGPVCRVIAEDKVLLEYQIGRDRRFGRLLFDIKGGGDGTSLYEVHLSPHSSRLNRGEFTDYLEAFQTTPEGGLPPGWSGSDLGVQAHSLRSHAGEPRVALTPQLVFPDDFELEVSGRFIDDQFGSNTTVIYLEGRGNSPDLRVTIADSFSGARVTFTGSEPQKVDLPARVPTRVVLEREAGISRLRINGQTLFTQRPEMPEDFARVGFILDRASSIDRVELRRKGMGRPVEEKRQPLNPPLAAPLKLAAGLMGSFNIRDRPLALEYSSRGELLMVVSDGSAYRWDLDRALAANRARIAMPGLPGAGPVRRQVGDDRQLAVLRVPGPDAGAFATAAISHDGQFIALGETTGNVRHSKPPAQKFRPREFQGSEPPLDFLAYSPASDPNRLLLAMGNRGGAVEVIGCADGSRIARFPTLADRGPISLLTFAPDGLAVVTGHEAGNVLLWSWTNAGEGRRKGELNSPRKAHLAAVSAMAFSSDGKRLATAGRDQAVRIWDVHAHSLIHEIDVGFSVTAMDVDHRGEKMAAGGENGQILVWGQGPRGPRQIANMTPHESRVAFVAFAPDGQYLVTAGADGFVMLWGPPLWGERDPGPLTRPLMPEILVENGLARPDPKDEVAPDAPAQPKPESGPTIADKADAPALARKPPLEVVVIRSENPIFGTVVLTVQVTNISADPISVDKLMIRARPGGDQVKEFKPASLGPGEKQTLKSPSIPISANVELSFRSPDGQSIPHRQK